MGHEVTAIQDAQEALRLLQENHDQFDYILTDLNMPGFSGVELVDAMRHLPFKGRIIVMSGFVSDEQKESLLLKGADVVLGKPVSPDDLIRELV